MSSRTLNLTETIYQYLLNTSLREHPAQVALTLKIDPENPGIVDRHSARRSENKWL